jgi:hypothetical protein
MLSTCIPFHVPAFLPGGELFLLLGGGGEEEDERDEDSTSSEQHRLTDLCTSPITSCCIRW